MEQAEMGLWENEKILWEGKRGRFRLLERGVRKIIFGKWMGTAAACAAVVGLYVTDQPAWNTGVVALTVLAALYVMLDPVQEWDSLQGQRYYLTDRRAVMVDEDGGVYAMDLDELDGFSTVEVDGGTCLVLGSSIRDQAAGQPRWYGCHPQAECRRGERDGHIVGMVFYGLENVGGAVECLHRRRGAA